MIRRVRGSKVLAPLLFQVARRNLVRYGVGALLVSAGHGAMAVSGALLAKHVVGQAQPLVLVTLGAAGLVGALLKWAGGVLVADAEALLSGRLAAKLRAQVAEGLLMRGLERGVEDVARVLGAIREIERAAVAGLLGALKALLLLAPLVIVLVSLVPAMALGALLVLAPFAIGLSRLRHSVRTDEQQALALTAKLELQMDELIRHADLWRTYGSGPRLQRLLKEHAGRTTTAARAARRRRAALSGLNEVLAALLLCLLVAAVSAGVLPVDGPTLVVFLSVFFLAYRPVRDLGDARTALAAGEAALEQLLPWLAPAQPGAPRAARADAALCCPLEPLELRGFGAARHPARWSLRIEPGEVVALVGPTGSGKSTLLRALLGLEPTEGLLRYGDERLDDAAVGPESRPFAWVPQEAPIVAGSLNDNLALACDDVMAGRAQLGALGGERLVQSLEGASLGADRFLSGGERAWVSLARALSSGQPVLLLDEPTASLDPASEQHLLATLEALRGRRSMLIVTHRPGPEAMADRVVRVPGW